MGKSSIGFQNKDWGDPLKKVARKEALFDVYRDVMDCHSIPAGRQYWSLCGLHGSDGCELPHALSDGLLVSADQFHGVDREYGVISHNSRAYPEAHWHRGEIDDVIEKFADLKPALINLDTVNMVDRACVLTCQVLFLLMTRGVKDCFVAVNFLLNNPRERSGWCREPEDFIRAMSGVPSCRNTVASAWSRGWRMHEDGYTYEGADKRAVSLMHTVYLYRKT